MASLAKVTERHPAQARRGPAVPAAALTAQVLCRAAMVILDNERVQLPSKPAWPAGAEPYAGNVAGLHGVLIYIDAPELAKPLEDFISSRLRPAIEAWAQTFRTAELGGEYLPLPMGCQDAANERWHGVAMRCVIMQDQPVGERDLPGRHWTKYYDVACDEFKEDYCSTAVSFWVHTPDTAARLLDAA